MQTAITPENVKNARAQQATNILAVLEALGVDFMVERTPLGKVQVSVTDPTGEVLVAMGVSVRDALGQVVGALALEYDVRVESCEESDEPADADQRIEYSLEEPVEFCTRFVTITEEDDSEPPRIGNLDRAVVALTMMAVGK